MRLVLRVFISAEICVLSGCESLVCVCFIGFFVPVDLVFVVVPVCWLNCRSRFIVV